MPRINDDAETTDTLPETTEVTETPETPEVEDAPQDPPAGEGESAEDAEDGAEGEAAEGAESAEEGDAPAYTPNFKYKYAVPGKPQEEREFAEIFKGVIKDAESEKLVRELHAKAAGADFLLESRNQLHQGFSQLSQQHEGLRHELLEVDHALKNQDYDTFLEKFGVPFEGMLQYVASKLRYNQMTPEERAQVDRQREIQTRATQGDLTVQGLQQQNADLGVQLRTMQLDMALNQADVQSMVQAVDSKAGAGAFKRAVIQLGKQIALERNYDASVSELIPHVIAMYQPFLGAPTTPGTPAAAAPGGAAPVQKREKPPVIPNISGRGGSPAKKEIGSLEELRARAKELRETAG